MYNTRYGHFASNQVRTIRSAKYKYSPSECLRCCRSPGIVSRAAPPAKTTCMCHCTGCKESHTTLKLPNWVHCTPDTICFAPLPARRIHLLGGTPGGDVV